MRYGGGGGHGGCFAGDWENKGEVGVYIRSLKLGMGGLWMM